MQIIGNVDVDEAVNRYAKMLSKYVDEGELHNAPLPESLNPDDFTTRFNSVKLFLEPHTEACIVSFIGRTQDGINLRLVVEMATACKEHMDVCEQSVIATLAKKRKGASTPIIQAVRGMMGWE